MKRYIKNTARLIGIGLLFYFAIVSKNIPEAFAVTSLGDCSSSLNITNETYTLTGDITGTCTVTANNITIDGQDMYTITGDVVVGDIAVTDFTLQEVVVSGSVNGYVEYGYDGANIIISNATTGNVDARGGDYGNAGDITITNATTGTINSSAGDYGNAGDITITNATTGNVDANVGADGNAGDITITNATTGNVDARGSESSFGNGGSGGDITITNATTGNVDARGGYSLDNGGSGGDVTITNATTGNVDARGGESDFDNGGSGGDIIITDSYTGILNTVGGTGSTNGTPGTLTLQNTAPALTVTPLTFNLASSATFDTLFGTVSATDQVATTTATITDDIVVTGTVGTTPGDYDILYEITDTPISVTFNSVATSSATNTTSLTRTITRLADATQVIEEEAIIRTQSGGRRSSSRNGENNNTEEEIGVEETTTNTHATSAPTFTTTLSNGSEEPSVKELQTLLNNINFTLATEGAGSPGNETNYYGKLTTNAVQRFQEVFDITPADGILNQQTRDWFNLIIIFR